MSEHPSELALEAHLLDPARSQVAGHLASCDRCRARIARMEKEGEDFRRFILPATLDAVVEKHARRRKPWLALAALVPAAAAAAALVIVIGVRRGPGEDYVGTKGALVLAPFVNRGGDVEPVSDGGQVPASAALRFRVSPSRRCSLWLVSVDESGQISRIYPASGETGAAVAQAGALPGGALLDGKPGLERFYAACTPDPLPFATLESAVKAASAAGVRRGDPLPDLPRGSAQATVLVEKR
jgi:anti-sigma factor RsiW